MPLITLVPVLGRTTNLHWSRRLFRQAGATLSQQRCSDQRGERAAGRNSRKRYRTYLLHLKEDAEYGLRGAGRRRWFKIPASSTRDAFGLSKFQKTGYNTQLAHVNTNIFERVYIVEATPRFTGGTSLRVDNGRRRYQPFVTTSNRTISGWYGLDKHSSHILASGLEVCMLSKPELCPPARLFRGFQCAALALSK